MQNVIDSMIQHDDCVWKVLATGTVREDGFVFCHLATVHSFRKTKNGNVPWQINDWVSPRALKLARNV